MSQTKKTYFLSKVKQLIDLNDDSTNFDLSFKVTCHDDTPFKVLVVDQTTLDNSEELNYKETKNSISGNIVADKNVYQNYFLILKAEKACKVDVELTKKDLPLTPIVNVQEEQPINNQAINNQPIVRQMIPPTHEPFNWKKIGLIVIIVIIGAGLLWYFYKKGQEKTDELVEKSFNDNEKDIVNSGYNFGGSSSHHNPSHNPSDNHSHNPSPSHNNSPSPNSYHPQTKFNSYINNSNKSHNISENLDTSKFKNQKGLSLLDRLKNVKI